MCDCVDVERLRILTQSTLDAGLEAGMAWPVASRTAIVGSRVTAQTELDAALAVIERELVAEVVKNRPRALLEGTNGRPDASK